MPFDRLQDPEAIANWPETQGRRRARPDAVILVGAASLSAETIGCLTVTCEKTGPSSREQL